MSGFNKNVGQIQGPKGETGPTGPKGEDGTSVVIEDSLLSKDELPSNENVKGTSYLIDGDLWVYNGNEIDDDSHFRGFENVGQIKGPKGDTGEKGEKGDNVGAYCGCKAIATPGRMIYEAVNLSDYYFY